MASGNSVNSSDYLGWRIGYVGGVLVSFVIGLFAPPLEGFLINFTYNICCGVICAEITARYRPKFWEKKNEQK